MAGEELQPPRRDETHALHRSKADSILEEDQLAPIAPPGDVVRQSRNDDAGKSGHRPLPSATELGRFGPG